MRLLKRDRLTGRHMGERRSAHPHETDPPPSSTLTWPVKSRNRTFDVVGSKFAMSAAILWLLQQALKCLTTDHRRDHPRLPHTLPDAMLGYTVKRCLVCHSVALRQAQ